jgi:hypothetical protein
VSRAFFDTVDDALGGFLEPRLRDFESHRTGMNLKVWYEEVREHYEVQLVSGPALEVGFHAEHRDLSRNEDVLERLLGGEKAWRKVLGREPQTGSFLGRQKSWRRVSEVWDGEGLTEDAAVEAAERLAEYISSLEPLRRRARGRVRAGSGERR